MLHNLISLIAPRKCALCGQVSEDICAECRSALHPATLRIDHLPLVVAVHEKHFVQVVVMWKDQRTKSLTPIIAELLAQALPSNATGALVPIPSRKSSQVTRGWNPLLALAAEVAKRSDLQLEPDVLSWGSEPREQRNLNDAERHANVASRLHCGSIPAQPIWLLDDVMTTGATLRAAAQSLQQRGGVIAGAMVVAAPRRSHSLVTEVHN